MFNRRRTLITACSLMFMLSGCSMKEEIRRIEAVKQAQEATKSARSSNLTGDQIFIRSCNTCHPSGRKGPLGPSLVDMDQHFKTDAELKAFIRAGKGAMPPQPEAALNDREMDNLIEYLHRLNADLKDQQNK